MTRPGSVQNEVNYQLGDAFVRSVVKEIISRTNETSIRWRMDKMQPISVGYNYLENPCSHLNTHLRLDFGN
jgi:hypothetical protein